VVDWGADHADIKWTKPENDGGSPITGYVIEYKVCFNLFIVIIHFCVEPFSLLFLFNRRNSAAIGSQQKSSLEI
jgi:hypothetical protein